MNDSRMFKLDITSGLASNCGGGRLAQDCFLGLEGRRVRRHAR